MSRLKLLIVEDDTDLRQTLKMLLKEHFSIQLAKDGIESLRIVKSKQVDIVLMDIRLPRLDGLKALEKIKEYDEDIGVVMLSALDSAQQAVSALKNGAYDYVTKPFDGEELVSALKRCAETLTLKNEVAYLRSEIKNHSKNHSKDQAIISNSVCMKNIFELIGQVGKTSSSVLITGESGTGKELVARAIHNGGDRKDKPFVAINCGAIPSELIESELFGHEKGAFTGAASKKIGRFEYANGGSIFLDEVATLPMDLQVKLLRVLQEMEFERVGSNVLIKVDIRVIAATNVNLEEALRKGEFREDLYYRLKVVPIEIPPLRERKEDIPLLSKYFLKRYSVMFNKKTPEISEDAFFVLSEYPWPGNVRELENLMERLVVIATDGSKITSKELPVEFFNKLIGSNCESSEWEPIFEKSREPVDDSSLHLKEISSAAARNAEKLVIEKVMAISKGNKSKAALMLHVDYKTLLTKIKQYNV